MPELLDERPNLARSTLTNAVDSSVTTITIDDATNFPTPTQGYNAVIFDGVTYASPAEDPNVEIVRVTGKTGSDLTVTRGQEGTSGAAHGAGDLIVVAVTKKMLDDIEAALYWDNAAGSIIESDTPVLIDPDNKIGVTSATGLWVARAGNGGTQHPIQADRWDDDGRLIGLRRDSAIVGDITVASGTVTYGTFCGSHNTQMKDGQEVPPIGGVVIADGTFVDEEYFYFVERRVVTDRRGRTREIDVRHAVPATDADPSWRRVEVLARQPSRFPHVASTTTRADPSVYGVYFGQATPHAAEGAFGLSHKPVHLIASVGLFHVRVTDTAGDISNGEYLQASTRQYECEAQTDDVLRSSTVAKALADVDWSTVEVDTLLGYKWRLIPATLHCG